jgi:CRP-like cAMP-binding protein
LRKRTLETLMFHFLPLQAYRGQVMCREGEPCRFIYIIQKGQFVLSKGFRVRRTNEIQLLKETVPRKHVEVARLVSGEMYGEIDALLNEPYHFTLICESTTADLLVITRTDFMERVMSHIKSDDMDIFQKKFLKEKIQFRNKRVLQIKGVLNQTKEYLMGSKEPSRPSKPIVNVTNLKTQ